MASRQGSCSLKFIYCCRLLALKCPQGGLLEDEFNLNAVPSSQRACFEDEREIPDRVGNDVGGIVLSDMVF